jgi:hypothetical protein
MDYISLPNGLFQPDTLLIQTGIDTAAGISIKNDNPAVVHDTLTVQQPHSARKDSAVITFYPENRINNKIIADTAHTARSYSNPFRQTFNIDNNFLTNNSLTTIGKQLSGVYNPHLFAYRLTSASIPPSRKMQLKDQISPAGGWLVYIFLTVILLFIWIKIFYNKFFSILSGSLASYQLSAKVFHEKNVLLKRVSFVLDIIYIIVLSVFLYEFFTFRNLAPMKMTSYNLFLLLFNILILFTVTRGIILKLFNYLFHTESIVSEYVHNNFIINKGTGIVLFPVVFSVRYMPEYFAPVLLWAGIVILAAGIVFKIIRGYQIIIRKDVLFIYLILYLCTLEILPLVLGYKVFMSLL